MKKRRKTRKKEKARKIRKVVYCTGTRADYGLARPVLFALRKANIKIELLITGMHLMKEFGHTINEVKKDGFLTHKIRSVYKKDDRASMAYFIGECQKKIVKKLKKINPDLVLILGDRAEMLATATASAYMGIPIAHMRGGELTSTIDDPVRHAISKLAHIHLCTTPKSAERLIKMGEEKFRVHKVGDPGLDSILNKKLVNSKINHKRPIIVMIYHPLSVEYKKSGKQASIILGTLKELGLQTTIIYPNADAGGRMIIKEIEQYRNVKHFRILKNVEHLKFLDLLQSASVLVGNSSCSITEAPSLKLATINIGTRQQGREQNSNVINVSYDKEQIKKAVKKALSSGFRKNNLTGENVYGDGNTGPRTAKILAKIRINKKLLQKRMTY